MDLKLRPASECKFDAVSLGEVMLRLDPGEGRIRTARQFRAWEGGGEYNVVRGLRRCFGLRTAVMTAFADNEVGMLMEDFILQGGVDTSLIKWMKTDGIGRVCRNGINFTERGYGIRGAVGCSDRANTAISKATPEDFDFDYIFGELGVRWLHTGGIYAALSEQACETAIAACKSAKKYGTIVSYDLNYRPSMWSAIGGKEKAQAVNKEIAQYVDVMIGNEEDFTACLGFEIEGNDENLKELNTEGISNILGRFLREEGLETPLLEHRALQAWPEVVGEAIARYTSDLRIRNGILYAKVSSAPLRQNLQMAHKNIADKINAHVGSHVLTDVKFV